MLSTSPHSGTSGREACSISGGGTWGHECRAWHSLKVFRNTTVRHDVAALDAVMLCVVLFALYSLLCLWKRSRNASTSIGMHLPRVWWHLQLHATQRAGGISIKNCIDVALQRMHCEHYLRTMVNVVHMQTNMPALQAEANCKSVLAVRQHTSVDIVRR